MRTHHLLLATPFLLLVACSSGESSDAGELRAPGDATTETVSPSPSPSTEDAGAAAPPLATDDAASEARARALFEGGSYRAWARESAPHASTGPHAARVLVFLNEVLDQSLAAGNVEHPKGSIAIKEFLDDAGAVTGFAYAEKTDGASAEGRGWYWFETFSRDPKGSSIAGQGKPLCANCHSGGHDFVLIPYPLR